MWIYKKEDLVEEINVGGNFLEKSGAYEVTIKEVVFKDNPTGSKQVSLLVETTSGQSTRLFEVYQGKDGNPIEFKIRILNQLCGILKCTPEKLSEDAIGKTIGMFLKAKLSNDKKYINFDLDGCYYPDKKLTTKEVSEKKTTPETYNKMVEKYKKETPIERGSTSSSGSVSAPVSKVVDDDFPF